MFYYIIVIFFYQKHLHMKNCLYLMMAAVLLVSCKAKKLRKQAYQFEQHGAFEQASDYYYKSLTIDNENVDAIVGYKKNTQIVLDNIHEEFYAAFKNADYKSAIYLYDDAKKLQKQANRVGVKLQKLNDYSVYYNEALDHYLEQQYNKGKQYLALENFNAAKTIFSEIVHFNEIFKDTKYQLKMATYEPLYLEGIKYLETNSNRKAYYQFTDILKQTDYKDALQLKNEALEKATIKIAIKPNIIDRRHNKTKEEFRSYFISTLNEIPSPFYKIIEVPSLKVRQPLDTQLTLAKNAGAKALFSLNIDNISYQKAPLKKESYKAYQKIKTSYKDKNGETKTKIEYKKITTALYSQSEDASINLEYKLISTIDRSVLINKVLRDQITDQVKYMKYKGDYKQLVPGYWEHQNEDHISDKVRDYSSDIRNLQSYFNSRTSLKTSTVLYNDLLKKMSRNIKQPIADYDPN